MIALSSSAERKDTAWGGPSKDRLRSRTNCPAPSVPPGSFAGGPERKQLPLAYDGVGQGIDAVFPVQCEVAELLVLFERSAGRSFVEMLTRQLDVDARVGAVGMAPGGEARLVIRVKLRVLQLRGVLTRPRSDLPDPAREEIRAIEVVVARQRGAEAPSGVVAIHDHTERRAARCRRRLREADTDEDEGAGWVAARLEARRMRGRHSKRQAGARSQGCSPGRAGKWHCHPAPETSIWTSGVCCFFACCLAFFLCARL